MAIISAKGMEDFVETLFAKTSDYKSLTQRIIREKYLNHLGEDDLTPDHRDLLRQIVKTYIVQHMSQGEEKAVSPRKASPVKPPKERPHNDGASKAREKKRLSVEDVRRAVMDSDEGGDTVQTLTPEPRNGDGPSSRKGAASSPRTSGDTHSPTKATHEEQKGRERKKARLSAEEVRQAVMDSGQEDNGYDSEKSDGSPGSEPGSDGERDPASGDHPSSGSADSEDDVRQRKRNNTKRTKAVVQSDSEYEAEFESESDGDLGEDSEFEVPKKAVRATKGKKKGLTAGSEKKKRKEKRTKKKRSSSSEENSESEIESESEAESDDYSPSSSKSKAKKNKGKTKRKSTTLADLSGSEPDDEARDRASSGDSSFEVASRTKETKGSQAKKKSKVPSGSPKIRPVQGSKKSSKSTKAGSNKLSESSSSGQSEDEASDRGSQSESSDEEAVPLGKLKKKLAGRRNTPTLSNSKERKDIAKKKGIPEEESGSGSGSDEDSGSNIGGQSGSEDEEKERGTSDSDFEKEDKRKPREAESRRVKQASPEIELKSGGSSEERSGSSEDSDREQVKKKRKTPVKHHVAIKKSNKARDRLAVTPLKASKESQKAATKTGRKGGKLTSDQSEDEASDSGSQSESSSDEEMSLAKLKTKQGEKRKKRDSSSASTSDTDIDDPTPAQKAAKGGKVPPTKRRKKSGASSAHDDDDDSKKGKTSKAKASKPKDPTKNNYVINLEKYARMCGAMPAGKKHKETFQDCRTPEQRIKILKRILRDAGMEGNPSMEKAEALKLRKEAQELDMGNIISSEGRSRRRNVVSMFARAESPSPRKPAFTPVKRPFSNLKGIVDSEESDSD